VDREQQKLFVADFAWGSESESCLSSESVRVRNEEC